MPASTEWQAPDVLSTAAREALQLNAGAAYARLTPTGPGTPEAAALLKRLTPGQLFTAPVRSPDDARAVLAGLWLYHDFLDESHTISQGLLSPTGSFWHAIMHRREGDFSNAKYWYARCRHHPAFPAIAAAGVATLKDSHLAPTLGALVRGRWDPDGFVDVVSAIHEKPTDPMYAAAVELQRAEWRGLFEHCVRAAAAGDSPAH
jgi:hypothetical protein